MSKYFTTEDDQGAVIAEGDDYNQLIADTEDSINDYVEDNVFNQGGYSNGDQYEVEYTIVHWNEHGDVDREEPASHIVEYYHGDYAEHNTLW